MLPVTRREVNKEQSKMSDIAASTQYKSWIIEGVFNQQIHTFLTQS